MPEMKIVTTEERKRRFKSACADQGLTMSDVANALIDDWLAGKIALPRSQQSANQQDSEKSEK
jgi:ParG